jgi:DNA-binding IclR family transcriptional regulator
MTIPRRAASTPPKTAAPGAARDEASSGVLVLDRAMAVVDAVSAGAETLGDIAHTAGLTRPTTHRLLKALQHHGWIARTTEHGYRLGPRLHRLTAGAVRGVDVRDVARPWLVRLAADTGESAQLYVRSGDVRICIDAVESTSELRTIVPVGAALPITAGSAGKAFMAWSRPEERARLARLAQPLTPTTPTGAGLGRQLSAARRRGWTRSAGEREPGVGSISAPVLDGGIAIAVVSISGPLGRFHGRRAEPLARSVTAVARGIEASLREADRPDGEAPTAAGGREWATRPDSPRRAAPVPRRP